MVQKGEVLDCQLLKSQKVKGQCSHYLQIFNRRGLIDIQICENEEGKGPGKSIGYSMLYSFYWIQASNIIHTLTCVHRYLLKQVLIACFCDGMICKSVLCGYKHFLYLLSQCCNIYYLSLRLTLLFLCEIKVYNLSCIYIVIQHKDIFIVGNDDEIIRISKLY